MASNAFIDIAFGRAQGFFGGYRGPKSHAMGVGSNAPRGTSSSTHTTDFNKKDMSIYASKKLQFPFNVESDPHQGHYIVFDIKKYRPASLQGMRTKKRTLQRALNDAKYFLGEANESKATKALQKQLIQHTEKINENELRGTGGSQDFSKARSAISVRNEQTKSSKASIALYMPPAVTTQYKVNYGNPEIALHTEVGLKAFEAFMADQGDFFSGLQAGAKASRGGLQEWAKKASLASVDKLLPGARVLQQMATGTVITPRLELMFESVGRRAFTYTFICIPKSLMEAEEVEQIVYQFKHAMHPRFIPGQGGNIRSMEIPDTFEITYMNNNGQNAFLNKISSCFLQSMDVQYGADRFTAYPEAKNLFLAGPGRTGSPPQRTQITLNFTELAILTQQDIEEGY